MQIQRQSRWTVDMIYAIIVGLVLGYSDVPFVLAVLLGLGLVLSKGVSEIFLKTDFIMKTPSPYVLYVMNLRQTGDTTPHPWISYLLQMILSGMAIFIVGFAITRWIF